jgi:xanthine dehydrogenase iron-sulfur cluster and FAD-binding subunit A
MLFRRHTLVPFLCGVQMILAAAALGTDIQAKIDKLNQREKQLIEKLEAVRQRERYIESKLEAVRRRKQALLSERTGLPVKVPGATPVPTPVP